MLNLHLFNTENISLFFEYFYNMTNELQWGLDFALWLQTKNFRILVPTTQLYYHVLKCQWFWYDVLGGKKAT